MDVGRTGANQEGKDCDGCKRVCSTPNGPRGMGDIGVCNLSFMKMQYFRSNLTKEAIKRWFCDGRKS